MNFYKLHLMSWNKKEQFLFHSNIFFWVSHMTGIRNHFVNASSQWDMPLHCTSSLIGWVHSQNDTWVWSNEWWLCVTAMYRSMGLCNKDVTPLLTHWTYVFLALTHRLMWPTSWLVWWCYQARPQFHRVVAESWATRHTQPTHPMHCGSSLLCKCWKKKDHQLLIKLQHQKGIKYSNDEGSQPS